MGYASTAWKDFEVAGAWNLDGKKLKQYKIVTNEKKSSLRLTQRQYFFQSYAWDLFNFRRYLKCPCTKPISE